MVFKVFKRAGCCQVNTFKEKNSKYAYTNENHKPSKTCHVTETNQHP